MAKDRVIGFLHDLVGDPKLNKQVSAVEQHPNAWVLAAKESGYEFSIDDLKVVSEEIAQKALAADNFIPELIEAMTMDKKGNGAVNKSAHGGGGSAKAFAFSSEGISRLKSVMQQGRY